MMPFIKKKKRSKSDWKKNWTILYPLAERESGRWWFMLQSVNEYHSSLHSWTFFSSWISFFFSFSLCSLRLHLLFQSVVVDLLRLQSLFVSKFKSCVLIMINSFSNCSFSCSEFVHWSLFHQLKINFRKLNFNS